MTRPASSRTMAANGLALPWAVGGNFKFHLNSALIAFSPFTRHDVLRKTAIFFNDSHPHTTVQCLGWLDGELLAAEIPAAVPRQRRRCPRHRLLRHHRGRLQPNKVISGDEMPTLDYDLDRILPPKTEHEAAIADFTHRLLRAGLVGIDRYVGMAGTAHALGSMVTGHDPVRSVVDPLGGCTAWRASTSPTAACSPAPAG